MLSEQKKKNIFWTNITSQPLNRPSWNFYDTSFQQFLHERSDKIKRKQRTIAKEKEEEKKMKNTANWERKIELIFPLAVSIASLFPSSSVRYYRSSMSSRKSNNLSRLSSTRPAQLWKIVLIGVRVNRSCGPLIYDYKIVTLEKRIYKCISCEERLTGVLRSIDRSIEHRTAKKKSKPTKLRICAKFAYYRKIANCKRHAVIHITRIAINKRAQLLSAQDGLG